MKKKIKSAKVLYKVFCYSKTFLIMRITVFLLLFSIIQVMGESSYSQNTRLSLNLKNVPIEKVLDEIENQSEFFFLFNQKLVNVDRKVDIDVKNKRIKDILAGLFAGEDINCLVMDRQILLSPKYITERVNITRDRQPQEIVVTGKVTDEDGNPLPGVNILIKGTLTGTITNVDGNYSIEVEDIDAVLVFSFIGHIT
ncbi:MAG: carboxypeptidase-like regulatory domain-containing protein, partial [Bacteroidetes bacterium]|nr:carboxypeptidase-like regulatory domain-containing protein [Bacteroidota bacterium]